MTKDHFPTWTNHIQELNKIREQSIEQPHNLDQRVSEYTTAFPAFISSLEGEMSDSTYFPLIAAAESLEDQVALASMDGSTIVFSDASAYTASLVKASLSLAGPSIVTRQHLHHMHQAVQQLCIEEHIPLSERSALEHRTPIVFPQVDRESGAISRFLDTLLGTRQDFEIVDQGTTLYATGQFHDLDELVVYAGSKGFPRLAINLPIDQSRGLIKEIRRQYDCPASVIKQGIATDYARLDLFRFVSEKPNFFGAKKTLENPHASLSSYVYEKSRNGSADYQDEHGDSDAGIFSVSVFPFLDFDQVHFAYDMRRVEVIGAINIDHSRSTRNLFTQELPKILSQGASARAAERIEELCAPYSGIIQDSNGYSRSWTRSTPLRE